MTDQREQHKRELTELHEAMDDESNDAVLRGISRSTTPDDGEQAERGQQEKTPRD